jgi:hypothetical protein
MLTATELATRLDTATELILRLTNERDAVADENRRLHGYWMYTNLRYEPTPEIDDT